MMLLVQFWTKTEKSDSAPLSGINRMCPLLGGFIQDTRVHLSQVYFKCTGNVPLCELETYFCVQLADRTNCSCVGHVKTSKYRSRDDLQWG